MAAEVNLKLVYEGGEADFNRLDVYDGTVSLHGFAKAVLICTNAFFTGVVSSRSTIASGVRIYLKPPRTGSFVEFIQIIVDQHPLAATITTGVLTNALYDFLKYAFAKAVGREAAPETPYVKRLIAEDELSFDELSNVLEWPLREGHRTIDRSGGTVSIDRPRSRLIQFDDASSAWVNSRVTSEDTVWIKGSITRFNVISKNGRLFDNAEKRVIPFKPADQIDVISTELLSWSLDKANRGLPALLDLEVKRVESARGVTKRYVVYKCTPAGQVGGLNPADRI